MGNEAAVIGIDVKALGAHLAKTVKLAVAEATEPLKARIVELEKQLSTVPSPEDVERVISKMMPKAEAGAPGPKGEPGEAGKSVTVEELTPLVKELVGLAVEAAVAKLPVPKDGAPGKDGEPPAPESIREVIRAVCVAELANLPKPEAGAPGPKGEPGAPGKDAVVDYDRIIEAINGYARGLVADEFNNRPAPKDGEPGAKGEPGEPGKDAVVDYKALEAYCDGKVSAAILAIPTPKDGVTPGPEVIQPLVDSAVAKAVAAIPPAPPGKSVDPEEVLRMVKGEVAQAVLAIPKPQDGKSVSLEEVKLLVDNVITKELATWPRPKDAPGIASMDITLGEDERTLCFSFTDEAGTRKACEIKVPWLLYRQPYKADKHYDRGDCTNHDGSLWVAMVDKPTTRPGTSEEWKMIVRKGRDGVDAKPGATGIKQVSLK